MTAKIISLSKILPWSGNHSPSDLILMRTPLTPLNCLTFSTKLPCETLLLKFASYLSSSSDLKHFKGIHENRSLFYQFKQIMCNFCLFFKNLIIKSIYYCLWGMNADTTKNWTGCVLFSWKLLRKNLLTFCLNAACHLLFVVNLLKKSPKSLQNETTNIFFYKFFYPKYWYFLEFVIKYFLRSIFHLSVQFYTGSVFYYIFSQYFGSKTCQLVHL